jgi:hypothetical protein
MPIRTSLFLIAITLACEGAGLRGGAAGQQQERTVCDLSAGPHALPLDLFETSGLARGVRDSTVFWTHNDGAAPRLFALDGRGVLIGQARVELSGLDDWEDLESSRCGEEPCLLLADIGDNEGARAAVSIHEVREPAPGEMAAVLRTLQLRYPDRAQDAEALFALPDGRRFIITKGRQGPVTLYRVPDGVTGEGVAVLERVRELAPRPAHERDRVTGASASPSGRWVAVRTYRTLLVYGADALLRDGAAMEYDLTGFAEQQGEGVVIDDAGAVRLTSESEQKNGAPGWLHLTCPLPAQSAPPAGLPGAS